MRGLLRRRIRDQGGDVVFPALLFASPPVPQFPCSGSAARQQDQPVGPWGHPGAVSAPMGSRRGGRAKQSLPRCWHPHAQGCLSSRQMCGVQGDPAVQRGQEHGGCCETHVHPSAHASPGPPAVPRSPAWWGTWLHPKPHAGPSPPVPPARVQPAGGFGSASLPPKGNSAGESETRRLQRSHRRTPPPPAPALRPPRLAGPVAAVATAMAVPVPHVWSL